MTPWESWPIEFDRTSEWETRSASSSESPAPMNILAQVASSSSTVKMGMGKWRVKTLRSNSGQVRVPLLRLSSIRRMYERIQQTPQLGTSTLNRQYINLKGSLRPQTNWNAEGPKRGHRGPQRSTEAPGVSKPQPKLIGASVEKKIEQKETPSTGLRAGKRTERDEEGEYSHGWLRSTTDGKLLGRTFIPAEISASLNISEATILFRETARNVLSINGI